MYTLWSVTLQKISKIDAARCQILWAKMHQIRFPLGLHPRSHWGAYSALPDPLAVFKGPTSKGGWERGGVKGRGREVDFV